MIADNRTFFFALLIFVTPLLGLPIVWKLAVIMIAAGFLMFFSVKFEWPHAPLLREEEPKEEVVEEKPISVLPPEPEREPEPEPVEKPKKRPGRPRKKKADISESQ